MINNSGKKYRQLPLQLRFHHLQHLLPILAEEQIRCLGYKNDKNLSNSYTTILTSMIDNIYWYFFLKLISFVIILLLTQDPIVIEYLVDTHPNLLHVEDNVKIIHVQIRFSILHSRWDRAFNHSRDIIESSVKRSIATGW